MRRYRALLVGNWHYPDDPANLPDLKGPLNDVSRLADVLADATVGLFEPARVTTLTERASHEIMAEMESFFGEATRDDVLLLYYSGHGITADDGSLLLCGRNARSDRKLATTVPAQTINQMVRGCPAAAVVIVLDCCHAGAFKSGDLAGELAGKGRFVLTASRARDRAPDAEHATGTSRFTSHLLRGLRGAAALAGATHVTLSDLYRYVHARMTEDGPVIPQRRFDGDGEVAIARRAVPATQDQPEPAVPAQPAPTAPPPQSSLVISEMLIDVGDVRAGEALPLERVQVFGRTADGRPAPWTAETEADWITLDPQLTHLDLRITAREGCRRANIHVTNRVTGEIRTIRVLARPVASGTTTLGRVIVARPAVVEPSPRSGSLASASHASASPASASPASASPASSASAGAAMPAGGLADAWDGWYPRPDAVAPAPTVTAPAATAHAAGTKREYPLHVPDAMLRQYVLGALRNHPVAGLVIQPDTRTRAEKTARERCGISPQEATLGALPLDGGGFVLLTDRALYWTNHGQVAALPYLRFRREFAVVPPAHVDFGDTVPRYVGERQAITLAALLNALLDQLAPTMS